ncbi:MAG TPA: hypothetical protein VD999_02725 [Vitreimonas sp.]|nr:hypothetical protein [Vitreimonas sp.]
MQGQTTQGRVSLAWVHSLERRQQQLIQQSYDLYYRELELQSHLSDYSFVVFPIAKAYEGFLKNLFFQMGLIDISTYHSRKFRIGRALNPDLHARHRDEQWLYDDIVRSCGAGLARSLWAAWLECRNHIFHYFPNELHGLSLEAVEKRLSMLNDAMQHAQSCMIEFKDKSPTKLEVKKL